jgi:hypothetical protein
MSPVKTLRLRFRDSLASEHESFYVGQVVDIDEPRAKLLLRSGVAVRAEREDLTGPFPPRPACCASCGSEALTTHPSAPTWICSVCGR